VDKGVQKAAREVAEGAWERHDVHELAAQSQVASAGKPKKIIKSDIVNLFVAWQLDKQSSVRLCGQHVSQCPCLMCYQRGCEPWFCRRLIPLV